MNRHTIRTSATDSVNSIPTTQKVDVNLKQTTKSLPFPNVSATLSQRSVYEEERQAGNKFRLTLTIVPYCSNVLFNPLTEIIKNEGSDTPEVITDENTANTSNIDVIGKKNPTRVEMISNTEYSSEMHGGYEYHPGYDFFDNHLLRNKTFKIVNYPKEKSNLNVFNTLADFMRDRNGLPKKHSKRKSIDSLRNQSFDTDKHLYMIDDILRIDESINQNLYEENGWWGFTNNTTIDPKMFSNRKWESMDIGKSLNNHRSCEFIDMYPDRTLYSFAPKYNKYTNESERNWNIVLTYPYRNIYDHPICCGGSSFIKRSIDSNGEYVENTISEGNRWMGLKVVSAQMGNGKIGSNNIIFRTYTNHGLKQGDMFYIYYTNPYLPTFRYDRCEKFSSNTLNGNEIYYQGERYFKVTNVGDMSRKNEDFCFYTSDMSLIKEIYRSYILYVKQLKDKNVPDEEIPFYDDYKNDDHKDIYDTNNTIKTDLLNKILRYTNFRVCRCVNGVKSTYYIRQFRKIPNLRAAAREMTEEEKLHTSKFNGLFEHYVQENATDPLLPNYQRSFNNEMYQLGFAANIYNDNVAQVTFTDGINVKDLTDNLGRPLSEIYYTIIKNNSGHEAWYEEGVYSNEQIKKDHPNDYERRKIEFSHCFGKITSGLELRITEDDTDDTTAPKTYWKELSSINHISNVINNKGNISTDTDSRLLDTDIHYLDNFFYGDLVEFNPYEFQEHTLSNVMHRFNTAQRETLNNTKYSQYQFHEIIADDYDKNEFSVQEFSAVNGMYLEGKQEKGGDIKKIEDYKTIVRPEGYYYKPHYKIPIRQYTRIQQGGHFNLRVRSAKPVQKNGILIQVTTYVGHGLSPNDIIYICDDESDTRYITRCVQVIDKVRFLMSPDYSEYMVNATDFEDKETISNIKSEQEKKESNNVYNLVSYKKRFSWLQLCEILNGNFGDDNSYPTLTLRRKNNDVPDYATYIGGNKYLWRNIVNIGDPLATDLEDFIFANGYFYVEQSINFYLKRQDPFGNNGLYFDGEISFPNDPSGVVQEENNYITKDTEVSC